MYEIRMAHATIHAHAHAACDLIPVVGGEGEETLPGRRCLSFFIIFFSTVIIFLGIISLSLKFVKHSLNFKIQLCLGEVLSWPRNVVK